MTEVDATVGEPFEVTLEQYGSSGYRWRLGPLPSAIRLLADETRPAGRQEDGSPSLRVLRMVADEPGEFALALELQRAWEAGAVKSGAVRVRARPRR